MIALWRSASRRADTAGGAGEYFLWLLVWWALSLPALVEFTGRAIMQSAKEES